MIKGATYDGCADVWSLGITLYELCEGEPPYRKQNSRKTLTLIASRPSPTHKVASNWSAECRDFLKQCLEQNVLLRPTISELLHHPWVKQNVQTIISPDQTGIINNITITATIATIIINANMIAN
jgi:serine/threonine protein kinase